MVYPQSSIVLYWLKIDLDNSQSTDHIVPLTFVTEFPII